MVQDEEPRFGVGKSIAFSLILIVSFLAIAELGVRGWAFYLRDDAERFDLTSQTFVLIPGEHRAPGHTARINSDGFAGPELEPDGPDLWRIAAVGDSCTYGDGNEVDTYPAVLDQLLAEQGSPDLRYEVVNAGISGLNSQLALRRLVTKVLPLQPDVVTIYIGWNDLMKFDPLAQTSADEFSGLARALDKLWLIKGMRKLIFFYLRPLLWPPATGPESRTGRLEGFRPTIFEANVREMIESVRGIGSRPVLVTLPTVLRPDMTVADLREAGVVFPYFVSAYGVGDLLDLIAAYNDSIRQIGREEQVPVIDLAEVFEARGEPTRYFFDTMHAKRAGMEVIAQELYRGLERERLLGPEESAAR